jgi:hypothetical protein
MRRRSSVEPVDLRTLLGGGDRRSIGGAEQASALIAADPVLFGAAVDLMLDANPVIRGRSADAVEKASRRAASLLQPHKERFLSTLAAIEQQEVKWHLLQILPRLDLSMPERETATAIADRALHHESRIVQAEALSALFSLAGADPKLLDRARDVAAAAVGSGAAAVRARARKLLRDV